MKNIYLFYFLKKKEDNYYIDIKKEKVYFKYIFLYFIYFRLFFQILNIKIKLFYKLKYI